MLPDFIKAKAEARKALMTILGDFVKSEPLLAEIPRRSISEGDRFAVGNTDGEVDDGEFERIEWEVSVSNEDIIERGVLAYLEVLKGAGEEIRTAQARTVIREIEKATEKTGNVSRGPLTFDTFIGMVERLDIAFAPDGSPKMPSIVAGPEASAKLVVAMKEWEQDPDKKKRMDELLRQKKAEWDDRESNRRLVD